MVIRSNLSPPPTFPATFWGLVPFLCAGGLALIFTALLVLLVEDDSSDSKLLGEQQSQLTSYQRWFVGLSEKEREWSMRSQSSYYDIHPSRGTSRVPQLRSLLLPRPAATSARCFQKGYLVRIHRTCSLFLILSMRLSTVHLADARPHSPTTSPPPTQAPSVAPMLSMAKLIMHRHVCIACFRIPFVNLLTQRHTFSFAFSDDALNSPCIRTCIDTYPSPVSLCPSQIPPAVHYYLSTTDDKAKLLAEHVKHAHNANNSQRNRNRNRNRSASHTHQHHYERCYDYDSFRCRPTVTIALFACVIVNHDNSRVASNTNRHPTLDICRLPEVRDEVKTDTMLHDVMLETSVPPIAKLLPTPIHVLLTVSPRPPVRFVYIYILYCQRTSYTSSRVS
jgi:hypothetical protein